MIGLEATKGRAVFKPSQASYCVLRIARTPTQYAIRDTDGMFFSSQVPKRFQLDDEGRETNEEHRPSVPRLSSFVWAHASLFDRYWPQPRKHWLEKLRMFVMVLTRPL
jgi:hypothetical protein